MRAEELEHNQDTELSRKSHEEEDDNVAISTGPRVRHAIGGTMQIGSCEGLSTAGYSGRTDWFRGIEGLCRCRVAVDADVGWSIGSRCRKMHDIVLRLLAIRKTLIAASPLAQWGVQRLSSAQRLRRILQLSTGVPQ
jgi:hypothetical protein